MNNAAYLDIQIDQGATFELGFTLEDTDGLPVSLAGAIVRGKIRVAPESVAVIATFVGSVVDATNGIGKVTLDAATTAALATDDSGAGQRDLTKRVFDIEVVYSDATVQRILEGICYISPEVTR